MFGVEDEAIVKDVFPERMRRAVRQHVQKVFRELECVLWGDWVVAVPESGPGCNDRREFGNEPYCRPIVVFRVFDLPAWIEHAERGDRGLQRIHRMSGFRQALQEVVDAKLDATVMGDVAGPASQFCLRRQTAEKEQIRGFEER